MACIFLSIILDFAMFKWRSLANYLIIFELLQNTMVNSNPVGDSNIDVNLTLSDLAITMLFVI